MGRIADFNCTYDHASGFGTWASEDYGIAFPQGYSEREMIAQLALAVQEHDGMCFCQLPFCHTLEAEALGGNVRLGDGVSGPRMSGYICRTIEEVQEHLYSLQRKNHKLIEHRRVQETLAACRMLKKQGKSVLFVVSGPMTILNGLVDSEILFRALLKKPELMDQIFEMLGQEILEMMKLAEEAGADAISYADPSGGINIVGPKVAARITEKFTLGFLKNVDRKLKKDTPVVLCPKTAFALIGTELAEWKDRQLAEEMDYAEAVEDLKGKIRFVGQNCIKNTG
ncbi:MAG: methylcobamide--CoM methyltransferase, partial [Lachnospiraceae bacterium]|nr:methylcobamide--CoM methyltransferase [Lachnospiraceae bacterium]